MIDDYEIGVLCLVPLGEEKAVAKMFAEFSDALVSVGVELLPLGGRRNETKLGSITALRAFRPIPDSLHGTRGGEQSVRAKRPSFWRQR